MDRFENAVAELDRLNAGDPQEVDDGGVLRPRELVLAERLAAWVARLAPEASEPLRLAAHCQHLMRWKVPRSDFPEGRSGYLHWRRRAAEFHADAASAVLERAGYDAGTVSKVRAIVLKEGLGHASERRTSTDVQTMEDALCLSFIQHELEAFAAKHEDEALERILKKTWRKMSPAARAHASELAKTLSDRVARLVTRAVSRA